MTKSWLDEIDVAAPCTQSWRNMRGDKRVRFCGACQMNVYNLSSLTREEAEKLVAATEGKICVRFFRRGDGTVLTEDCPKGVVARLRKRTVAVAASFLGFFGVGSVLGFTLVPVRRPVVMGAMRCPPRTPTTLPTANNNGTTAGTTAEAE